MPEVNVWATPRGDAWQLMVSVRQPTAQMPAGVMAYHQQPIGSPMTALHALSALRRLHARLCA